MSILVLLNEEEGTGGGGSGFPATFPATFPGGVGGDVTVNAGPATINFTAAQATGAGNATVASAGSASVNFTAADATTSPFTAPGVSPTGLFDAVNLPKFNLYAGVGVGGAMTLINPMDANGNMDVRSISRSFGRNTPIDSCDPASLVVVFNNASGDYDPAYASSPYYPRLTVGVPFQLKVEWPTGTQVTRFDGTVTSISLDAGLDPTVTITAADGLEKLGRTELPAGTGFSTFTSLTTGTRIDALATQAAWTGARAIDTGNVPLWPSMALGATALELMRKVEMTEMGTLFCAENGTLTFWDRYHPGTDPSSVNVQLNLTDTGAAGTVGMMDLVVSRDRDRVHNDIHLTREADPAQDPNLTHAEPGDEPSEQIAQDTTSIGTHGYLNLPAEVAKLHRSDAAVLDQASMLLSWYATVTDRIEQVTINLLHPRVRAENLFGGLLSLTLLNRIAVSRNYGPRTITGNLHVEKVEEEINADPPTWQLRLTTTNVTPTIPRFTPGTSVPGTDPVGW